MNTTPISRVNVSPLLDDSAERTSSTGMPIRRTLTPIQRATLERTFYLEFKRRTKAGEPAPFAGMMAARAQLIERNLMMNDYPRTDISNPGHTATG